MVASQSGEQRCNSEGDSLHMDYRGEESEAASVECPDERGVTHTSARLAAWRVRQLERCENCQPARAGDGVVPAHAGDTYI